MVSSRCHHCHRLSQGAGRKPLEQPQVNKAGTSRQPPPPEPPLHTRHHCFPRTTPPRRNTTSQHRRRPNRGPRSSPVSRGQEEEEGNLTEASKEGIGAKGVDFAVAAALAKGLPRFQLTTSSSQPPEPKDSTTPATGIRRGPSRSGKMRRAFSTRRRCGPRGDHRIAVHARCPLATHAAKRTAIQRPPAPPAEGSTPGTPSGAASPPP